MKKTLLASFLLLASLSSAIAGTVKAPIEGGGHVGVDLGADYRPFYQASYGYNVDAGKAWLRVEFGRSESVDGGSLWDNTSKEVAVEGLTLNTQTGEIELFGVPCAKARPNAAFNFAEYPVKDYRTCTLTPSYRKSTNFKGETIVHTTITLSSER